ncbi:MAG: hypothetical protein IJI22_03655 [Bacilli bacterium]|nr:hypothetical protein [Bacilli bacterium]
MLQYYLEKLGSKDLPEFMIKYLDSSSMKRLKNVSCFCAMDYASKDIYDFRERISRFDHSLSTSLLTYRLTGSRKATLAGLFHDISTPCSSHVIDYMNKDYERQESTEEYTESIIMSDKYLVSCLESDGIDPLEVIDFKKYSVVDTERPKLCADRLDGIILPGIAWTKNITLEDIDSIVDDITIFKNEDGEEEIGFKTYEIALRTLQLSDEINAYCHTNEDNYMMHLLANIMKYSIDKNYFSYQALFIYDEEYLFSYLNTIADSYLQEMLDTFKNIKLSEVPYAPLPKVKSKELNPMVNGVRIK